MKLKSATFVAQTKAVFTQLSSAASVTTLNRILASVQAGNFILFASLFDTFYIKDGAGASDGAVLEFFKTLTDDAAVAEEATNSFMKSLSHTATFDDRIDFFAFGKSFQNTSAVAEAYAAHIQKPFSDGFSVAEDAASLHPNKGLFEAPAAADAINTFGVGKANTDVFTALDAHAFSSAKPLNNSSSAADATSKEPGKVLNDIVTKFDDQTILFTMKAPDNPVGAVDGVNTKGIGKSEEDTAVSLDQATRSFNKDAQDIFAAIDEINSFSTSKQIVDSIFVTDDVDGAASILDDQEMQFVKLHTDVVGVGDSIQIGIVFTRQFIDTGVALDSVAFAIAKALSDGYTISDVANVLTGKHVSDTFALSETHTKAVTAARTDSALLGDAHASALSKVLSDTPLIADAGSLRSQGYCDFTYFAEDYVGASRTFT
jgi:hypothetical protein